MTASIHPIPTRANALALARAVTSRPDMHSNRILLDACDVLDDCGDWYDMQSATMMRHIMRERAQDLVTDVTEPRDDTPGDMSGWAWVFWSSCALWLAVTLGVIGWLL